jgi:hypothetical protein
MLQVPACDRCSQGVMDATNDHLRGLCPCACHGVRCDGGNTDRAAEQPSPWNVEPAEDRDRAAHVTGNTEGDW